MSGQRVGVVGDERLPAAVGAAGGVPVELDPGGERGPGERTGGSEPVAFAVASGESALTELVRAESGVAVLPVDMGGSIRSVPFDRVEAAVERVLDGEQPTDRHPIVAVTGSVGAVRILFDVALVAAEPAKISEFAVRSGSTFVSRFRADGVVASTPAGSGGYNRNAGGPVIEPGTGVASVVPIAPFATAPDQWVLPIESVRLSVERDETPVELLADGRREGVVSAGEAVSLSRIDTLETYVVPELDAPF
jgi:NAD+ kinase